MNIIKLLPLIALFLFLSINAFGLDTTGVKEKLNICYRLNKKRDVKLIDKAKELLPIANSYPNSDLAVRIYTLTGRGFMNNFQFDSSKKYYDQAEQNLSTKVSSDAKGKLMMAKGWNLEQISNENEAFKFYLKAYDYFLSSKDSLSLAGVLGNMASLMDALNQFDKGLIYSQKALDIYKLKNDTLGVLLCLNNIGSNYMDRGEFKRAISYLNQSIRFSEELNYSKPLISIYANLGECYIRINKISEAEEIGNGILRMNFKIGTILGAGRAYFLKSFACSSRNEQDLALAFADSSIKYLQLDQNVQTKSYTYKGLVKIYSKYKVFDKALRTSLKCDTLLLAESESGLAMAFAKLENDFQLKNSKSEIESLKSLSESQANQVQSQKQIIGLTIGIVIIFIIAFLLTFYLFRKSKLAEKEIQAKNQVVAFQNQELKKQNELQLMTIGIVGHDLRGPLASAISIKEVMISLLQAGKVDKCIQLSTLHFDGLERIHKLTNNLVQWVLSAQSGISLNFSEIKVVALVDKVSNVFVGELKEKNITLQNNVGQNVTIFADAASVETILRNIIQNAIKFTPDGKKITISSLESDLNPDFVTISINDEGKGMPSDILEKLNSGNRMFTLGTRGEKGNGLGLIMIQTLLSLNNGKMKISSEIGVGTSFSVLLPYRNLNI